MKEPNPVVAYYHTLESKLGYRWLQGVKHFGFYPAGKENITKGEAQRLMNEELAKRLALPAGARVLDAGCGEGGVALQLAKNYELHVSGVDLLDFNITRANADRTKYGLSGLTDFSQGTYMELPFEDEVFDGVYTMETLVHASDYRKALREFHRVLKPGGKIILFEYALIPPEKVPRQDKKAYDNILRINRVSSMPSLNEFYIGSFPKKLRQAGFTAVKTENITARVLPMLKEFARLARKPYAVIKLLRLQDHFINAMSAVEFYDHQNLWEYTIVIARKK